MWKRGNATISHPAPAGVSVSVLVCVSVKEAAETTGFKLFGIRWKFDS